MTGVVERRAAELFERLAELPPEQAAEALAAECGSDVELLRRVQRMLEVERRIPAGFLDGGAAARAAPPSGLRGYEILSHLGQGAMGIVYAARQTSPLREVAVKVLRPGSISASALRRFEHEIDVLGNLEHPGIARIYEAGTAVSTQLDGEACEVPYFAMELVRGRPLCEYADARGLGVRARLELLARVCDAVHHAHQRGVIHRDLKSENILVTDEVSTTAGGEARSEGQPKVLDFGIARFVGDDVGRTLETRQGDILGTLTTMSPEQVGGDSGQVDVRSDVHALGAVLYQLLSGRPPIDLTGVSVPEAIRRIQEVEPVPLARLDPRLGGDVSVIAATALQKDKERRYQTASDLAADLRRHLRGEAIAARSDSTFYVLGKGLRRHRALVAGVALAFVLITTFAIVVAGQASENRDLATREASARREAEAALAFSNIERGRLLGREGNPVGEELLWREFLRDPDSTHAFWALWEFCGANPFLASRQAHADRVWSADFSADGSLLATGGADGAFKLWEADTLREHLAPVTAGPAVTSVAFHPGGELVFCGRADGSILEVDRSTGDLRRQLEGHTADIHSLRFHPGGRRLLSASADGTARVFDLDDARCLAVLGGHDKRVWCGVYSPDGDVVATAGGETVRLWSAPFEEPFRVLEGHEPEVVALAFSRDGRRLWSGGSDRLLFTWDLETGEHTETEVDNGTIRRLWTSADGADLFCSGWWRVEQRDAATLELSSTVPLSSFTWGVALTPSERRIALGDNGGLLRLRSLAAESALVRVEEQVGATRATLSPDGARFVTGDADGAISIGSVATREVLQRFEGPAPVRTLDHHPTRPWVLVTGGGRLEVLDLDAGAPRYELEGVSALTDASAVFSGDGSRIAVACRGSLFRVLDSESGEVQLELSADGAETLAAAWTAGDRELALLARGRLRLHASDDGRRLRELDLEGLRAWTIAASPDGRYLAAATWDAVILVWEMESRAVVARLRGHETAIWDLAFVPHHDGLLASCSEDGTVRIWSVPDEINLAVVPVSTAGAPIALDAGPLGELLTIGTEEGQTALFDLTHAERLVAASFPHQSARFAGEIQPGPAHARFARWVDEVLGRPWPRFE